MPNKQVVMYNNRVGQVATAKCQKGGMNGGSADFMIGKSFQDDKVDGLFLPEYL